jgi:hypothetical protein
MHTAKLVILGPFRSTRLTQPLRRRCAERKAREETLGLCTLVIADPMGLGERSSFASGSQAVGAQAHERRHGNRQGRPALPAIPCRTSDWRFGTEGMVNNSQQEEESVPMVAVRVSEEGVVFENLESHDPEVVSFFTEMPVESLGDLAGRAMTVGVLGLRAMGTAGRMEIVGKGVPRTLPAICIFSRRS